MRPAMWSNGGMANRQAEVDLRLCKSPPSVNTLAWLGLAWLDLTWLGLAWLGLAWNSEKGPLPTLQEARLAPGPLRMGAESVFPT